MTPDTTSVPGAELVLPGLRDLREGRESTEALLVAIGASRLRALGFEVPAGLPHSEHRLYDHLAQREGLNAHSAYNALIRRLVSFERAWRPAVPPWCEACAHFPEICAHHPSLTPSPCGSIRVPPAVPAQEPGRVLRARRDGRLLSERHGSARET